MRAGGDAVGDDGGRLQPRRAEAVDGHGRRRCRAGRPGSRPGGRRSGPARPRGARSRGRGPRWPRGSTSARRSASRDDQRAQVVGAGVLEDAARARARWGSGRPKGWRRHAWFRLLLSSAGACSWCSMCWMRSRVFGSPHSERKASRSRSRMCCSLTVAPAGTAPPDRMRARWPLILASCSLIWCAPSEVVQRRAQGRRAGLADDADAPRRRRAVAGARQPERQLPWRRRSASRAPSRRCRPGAGSRCRAPPRRWSRRARVASVSGTARAPATAGRTADRRWRAPRRAPPSPCSRRPPGSGRRPPRRSRRRARPRRAPSGSPAPPRRRRPAPGRTAPRPPGRARSACAWQAFWKSTTIWSMTCMLPWPSATISAEQVGARAERVGRVVADHQRRRRRARRGRPPSSSWRRCRDRSRSSCEWNSRQKTPSPRSRIDALPLRSTSPPRGADRVERQRARVGRDRREAAALAELRPACRAPSGR